MFTRLILSAAAAVTLAGIAISPGDSIALYDTADIIPICTIQGRYFSSAYVDRVVSTRGVVFADLEETGSRGFFMQDENCDTDPQTSNGIFVYLDEKYNLVASDDYVEVRGTVAEYYGRTELITASDGVSILGEGEPPPVSLDLYPPSDNQESDRYLESHEGMFVSMPAVNVVGPTNADGETWVIASELGIERVFRDDPAGTGEVVCLDDQGLYTITPQAKVGDEISGIRGALDYVAGTYRIQLVYPAVLHQSTEKPPIDTPQTVEPGFSVGTFNLANYFDAMDDPDVQDMVYSTAGYYLKQHKLALTIHEVLGEPDVLAVQEVENSIVLNALVNREEISSTYQFAWEDGPDIRGIDTALLYNTANSRLLDSYSRQGCTQLVDGLGPDGNLDMLAPENTRTCDTNSDGVLDGNRLFSRPPLFVQLAICPKQCDLEEPEDETILVWFVAVHLKSKMQDTKFNEYTLPRRIDQVDTIARWLREMYISDPNTNIILLGDLNDYPTSQPVKVLTEAGAKDLTHTINQDKRYSYIYQGVSQILDYVMPFPSMYYTADSLQALHTNADFPYIFSTVAETYYRSSDHDGLLVNFEAFSEFTFLPYVSHE